MKLPTLDNFLKQAQTCVFSANSYVTEPGFAHLYVRFCKRRYIEDGYVDNVFDLANLKASTPGNGAFSALVERLRRDYPNMGLYVECVLNPRFGQKLERMGFKRVTKEQPFSYFMSAI